MAREEEADDQNWPVFQGQPTHHPPEWTAQHEEAINRTLTTITELDLGPGGEEQE